MPTKKMNGIRRDLLKAARSAKTVTYGRLMNRYGLSRGRRLSQTIGEVDRAELLRGAPGFAAIIVRKDTGFPGGGFFCDDELPQELRRNRSRASDARLSPSEIRYVKDSQRRIWTYYGSNPGKRR